MAARAMSSHLRSTPNIIRISIACEQESYMNALEEASAALCRGSVVALPTDTIYGIACSVNSDKGIEKMYEIKGRDAEKPVAICVAEIQDMYRWANITLSQSVLELLFPGKITAVFKRKDSLNVSLNPQTSLIGIRIPNNDFIRELVRRCQYPIALTSANKSGATSTLQIEEFQDIWSSLEVIVDQGKICDSVTASSRLGSTVIDVSDSGYFSIIRNGSSYDHVIQVLTEGNIIQKLSS